MNPFAPGLASTPLVDTRAPNNEVPALLDCSQTSQLLTTQECSADALGTQCRIRGHDDSRLDGPCRPAEHPRETRDLPIRFLRLPGRARESR